jgi:hypothetical protein
MIFMEIQLKFKLWLILSKINLFLFSILIEICYCRLYYDEEEFAVVNDRIRRGDIVGAKGKPSKQILHCSFFFIIRICFIFSTNKKR